MAADVAIAFKGNINICGHDHRADTQVQASPPVCDASYHAPAPHTTCLPGAWSSNVIQQNGSPNVQGSPSNLQQQQATGFYSGPWDVLGMQQSEFWSWVGTRYTTEPNPPQGIFYLDNDAVKQNGTGDFAFNGGDGEGFLYVDGYLTLNGAFTWRGLIYTEGDLAINGNAWILGGIVVKGKASVKIANGSAIVLYSTEAIQQKITRYGGNIRTIAWREQ